MELVPYTVRSRNTLFGIAQFFQTSVEDILKYNNIPNPSQIFVGQTLEIPAGSAEIDYYEFLSVRRLKFRQARQRLTTM